MERPAQSEVKNQSDQKRPGRLYAHWLDGEWQRIASPITIAKQFLTLQAIGEGWLKFHALFGTRMALSDIQVTDSPLTLRMFADPAFREFLKHDKDFLTLVSYPRRGFEGRSERLGRATRGLERAHQNGWKTSLPHITVEEIKTFSDPILSAAPQDTNRWLRDRSRGPGKIIASFPQHKELLEGMLQAVCYFTKKTGGPSETPDVSEPRSYTDFFLAALNSKGIGPEELAGLEGIWRSIEKTWVPDEGRRPYRSALIDAMESKEPERGKWPVEWHRIWNTVNHAWNETVSGTVGAERSSIAELPEAIVPFRGVVSDVVTPRPGGLLEARMPKKFPVLNFDPSDLSWIQVKEAVQKTRPLRNYFQAALKEMNADDIRDSGAELIGKLSETITPRTGTVMPKRLWIPLSLFAFAFHDISPSMLGAIEGTILLDHVHSWLKTEFSRARVLNTLHGFRDEVVSAFTSSAQI